MHVDALTRMQERFLPPLPPPRRRFSSITTPLLLLLHHLIFPSLVTTQHPHDGGQWRRQL